MKSPATPIRAIALTFLLIPLAACEDMGTAAPARNFDELIPRLMGSLKKATPEEAAANLFDVTSPDERRDAIAYLQTKPWGHEPPYMKAYQVLTTDPHPMVRGQAMLAMGTSHQVDAVSYLIKGLNDSDAVVRRDAAVGLISTFTEAAIAPLIQHVREDFDSSVRLNCARALKNAPTTESMQALIATLADRDSAVVYSAHASLVAITHEDFGEDRRAWLSWFQKTFAPSTAPASPMPTIPR